MNLEIGVKTIDDTNTSNDALLEMQMTYLRPIEPTTAVKHFYLGTFFLNDCITLQYVGWL